MKNAQKPEVTDNSIRSMLERDIFIKEELKKMFKKAFMLQGWLISICTAVILIALMVYTQFSTSQDMVTLRKIKEERVMLKQDRAALQSNIDTLHSLIKVINLKLTK